MSAAAAAAAAASLVAVVVAATAAAWAIHRTRERVGTYLARSRNQEARSPSEIPKQKITHYVVDDVAVVAFAPRDA